MIREKEIRTEYEVSYKGGGSIHAVVGESNFTIEQLTENFQIIYDKVNSLRPEKLKGSFLKSITLSTNMGPGIKLTNF